MTPKQKCDQLIKKYKPIVTLKMGFEHSYILKKAKQCALIAVDELIKWMPGKEYHFDETSAFCVEYWELVKKEIEKL